MDQIKKIFNHISNEWQWYNDKFTFPIFCYLVYKASHKPEKHKGKEIEDGYVIFTEKELAQIFSCSRTTIRNRLSWLQLDNKIKCETTAKNTNCIINNFSKFKLKFESKDIEYNQVIRFLGRIEKQKVKAKL
ncbi:MAG: hypothetical protein Q8J88_01060 [Bacteroidales bacterium]|nr:hypothetical protein [Bacteroidales bacterium]